MKTYAIYINNESVDLFDPYNLDIAITLAIADSKNITGRKSGNTKSIKLPATANNKKIFGHPNDFNSVVNVDQTTKPKVRIDADGTQIFRGFAKVNSSTDIAGINITEYEIHCIGDNGDWIKDITGKKISDIDYSDQNHTRNIQTVNGSETIIAGREYVYDLVDRGQFTGISIPNNTPKKGSVSIMDRYPALNIYNILKRIYQDVGYKISSTFLDSAFFRSLYWAFVQDKTKVDQSFATGLNCEANFQKVGPTNIFGQNVEHKVILNNIVTNPSGAFGKFFSSEYFCEYSGKYELYGFVKLQANIKVNINQSLPANFPPVTIYAVLTKRNDYLNTQPVALETFYYSLSQAQIQAYGGGSTQYFAIGQSINAQTLNPVYDLVFGDNIYWRIAVVSAGANVGGILYAASLVIKEPVEIYEVGEGKYFDFNLNLPITPQIDYIQGLKELFNLQFFTDVDSRTVFIEPYDDFYEGELLDLSSKMDVGKDLQINFLGSSLSKTIRYKYKDDPNDKFVKQWEEDNEIPFCSDESIINNEFAKDEIQEISNKVFSATWMNTCERIGFKTSAIPRMWSDVSLPPKTTKFNPRILIYQGLKTLPTGDYWRMNPIGTKQYQTAFPNVGKRTTYPSFIFFDDSQVNDNNLSFADRNTSSGLQQKFYRNKQNTLDDGRQYVAFINFNDVDISNIDFRRKVYIEIEGNGAYFILDKISNYKSQDQESTMCLFTKVGSIKALKKLTYIANGIGITGTGNGFGKPKSKGGITADGTDILVSGIPKIKITDDGALSTGEIVVEINNIIHPVYYLDNDGNWEHVVK